VNSPIPPGALPGYHDGGWGKPPTVHPVSGFLVYRGDTPYTPAAIAERTRRKQASKLSPAVDAVSVSAVSVKPLARATSESLPPCSA
jgi:hypothetical protein